MPNPSGLYSRIKTWGSTDTILGADLNAEFDNVLSNFNPEMLAGYSQNVAQMQTQTSPGAVGSESLATSLSGELERLRYQIAQITGNTYWYTAPTVSLSQVNSLLGAAAFGNKINSGLTTGTTGSAQPAFLVAANTTNSVTLKATATAFSYAIAGTTYNIAADVTLTGLTQAPSSQNTATVSDLTLPQAGTQSSQILGENGSTITVASMGTNITSLVGNIAAFKTTASEYMIGRVDSTTQIRSCYRGYFFNSSSALVSRGTLANGDTLTLMKLAWIYVNSAGGIVSGYTNPKSGGIAPSSPASNDYWYDTSVNYWKIYNGTSWIQANVTLIGVAITDTANTVATRSFDFFESYSDLNTCELFADSQNSGTVVRSRYTGSLISVYGSTINLPDYAKWDFALHMDTGSQVASTIYYFYLDMNGRPWISKVAPFDRRADLKGYYHPGNPWRCVGYGYSNALTLVDNVESFFRTDDATPVSNITAANNNIILPYNILPREQIITINSENVALTQVLPPPAQLRGKFLTYVRTDNNIGTAVNIQSWGTAVVNPTGGTLSITSNVQTISGLSATTSIAAGQLITGPGIPPNSTVTSAPTSSTVVFGPSAPQYGVTGGTYNFANSAGAGSGTIGQQTNYFNYGINGFFSVPLYSQGETVTITSDGIAYYIVQHYIPSTEQDAGALTITGSTSNPTKGTTTRDNFIWKRVGSECLFRYEYKQTGAGSAGSGDYQIGLPTGITIDVNKVLINATVFGATNMTAASNIGIGNNLFAGAGATLGAYPLSSTQFKIYSTGTGVWSSGLSALNSAAVQVFVSGRFPVPGWFG